MSVTAAVRRKKSVVLPERPMPMQTCGACGTLKSIDEFGTTPDGLRRSRICNNCKNNPLPH